jgi:tRNA 2-thiouridine synthesizing protein A
MRKKIIEEISLLGEVCPMTFVKTRLALEKINTGERIKVLYDSNDAKTNIPKSLEELNYKIIKISKLKVNNFFIIIEK